MNKQEFLKRRQVGIGGSDIAAIIGISPWRSPRDIYMSKKGLAEPEPETDAMYWGTTLEDVVAREYSLRTGRKIQRCNTMFAHENYPFLIGNVDRVVCNADGSKPVVNRKLRTNRILECKTASQYSVSDWGPDGTDQIPEHYKCQVQWYMGITGADFCDVAVLIGNRDFRMYEIKRDETVIAYLFNEGVKFWNDYILTETLPPARSIEDVENAFKGTEKSRKFADDETIAAVQKYAELDAQKKAIIEQQEELKLKICDFLGDNVELVTPDSKKLCSWSASKQQVKTDWKRAAEAGGVTEDIINAFTTETMSARRFTVTLKQ